jgi:ActR/RegA family two-component response regulator
MRIGTKLLLGFIPLANRVTAQESWMSSPFSQARDEFEKFYITHILKESNWNISEASRKAQMFRQNLQQKIRKYPLSLDGRGLALWSKLHYSTG